MSPFTDVGPFDAGKHYQYSIVAVNCGGSSNPTAPVDGWTAANIQPPATFTATTEAGGVRLNWSAVTDVARYRLTRNGQPLIDLLSGTTTYLYAEKSCGTSTYCVTAQNCRGTSTAKCVSWLNPITPADGLPGVPALVSPLGAALQCQKPVTLAWQEACLGAQYEIEWDTSDQFPQPWSTVTTSLSYSLNSVTAGTTYYWRVRSSNVHGTSSWSSTGSFRTAAAPTMGTQMAPYVIRKINGTEMAGPVYWGETGTIDLYPVSECPCIYDWVLTNGQPEDYATGGSGNHASCTNIGVLHDINLTYQVTVSNGFGSYQFLVGFTLYARARPEGGCPYVAVWDGNRFLDDNNVLPASEYMDGLVTDHYQLTVPARMQDGVYVIKLREFEEHQSQIASVGLWAVDHPLGTQIDVTPEGSITLYRRIQPLDVEGASGRAADGTLNVKQGDMLRLGVKGSGNVAMTSSGSSVHGVLLRAADVPKAPVIGTLSTGDVSIGFTFRQKPAPVVLSIGSEGFDNLQASFRTDTELSEAALVEYLPWDGKPVELPLVSADHSQAGRLAKFSDKTQTWAELVPGQDIELRFAATPLREGMDRSLVFVTKGRYEKVKESSSEERVKPILLSVSPSLKGSSVRLAYSTAAPGFATLRILNVAGREVARLADGPLEAGDHSATWDTRTMAAGIYFARLSLRAVHDTKSEVVKILVTH